MPKVVLLDAGPLGMVAHPNAEAQNTKAAVWLKMLLDSGTQVVIPEIADYEVRRELLRAGLTRSVRRLDQLKQVLKYLPLSTDAMLKAAEFWADARMTGKATAKDDALDADVILAGQAVTIVDIGDDAVIATTNVKHLSRFANAELWENIG